MNDDSRNAMRQAIEGLLTAGGERHTRQVLEALGAKAAMRFLAAVSPEQHARQLRQQGVPRAVANQRIAQAHGVHRRTAERITERVLSEGPLRR